MNNKIFVDTLFIVALINRRDQYHDIALALAKQFESYPLITTDVIFFEVGNALAKNNKKEAINLVDTFLKSDEIEVIHLTPQLFQEALQFYQKYQDKEWGLVDCLSFIVMTQNQVTQALTFDKHFIQAGFQALMR